MSGCYAEDVKAYTCNKLLNKTASLFVKRIFKDNLEMSLWLQSTLLYLSESSTFIDKYLVYNPSEYDVFMYLFAFCDLGLDYNYMTISAREAEKGLDKTYNPGKEIMEKLNQFHCLKYIITEHLKDKYPGTDSDKAIFLEIEEKRNLLANQITAYFGNNSLRILFFLSGYKYSAVKSLSYINNWVAIEDLQDFVSGKDYKLTRAIVPVYIWIKCGMKPLRGNLNHKWI